MIENARLADQPGSPATPFRLIQEAAARLASCFSDSSAACELLVSATELSRQQLAVSERVQALADNASAPEVQKACVAGELAVVTAVTSPSQREMILALPPPSGDETEFVWLAHAIINRQEYLAAVCARWMLTVADQPVPEETRRIVKALRMQLLLSVWLVATRQDAADALTAALDAFIRLLKERGKQAHLGEAEFLATAQLDKGILAQFVLAFHETLLGDFFGTTSDDLAKLLRVLEARTLTLQQAIGPDSDLETILGRSRLLLRGPLGRLMDDEQRRRKFPLN